MVASTRNLFFFIDTISSIVLISFLIFLGEERWYAVRSLYAGLTMSSYALCYFLSSAFFINLEHQRYELGHNILALLKGTLAACVLVLGGVFFFFKPYREELFYETMLIAGCLPAALAAVRTMEWKFFWPRQVSRLLILGNEPYLHLYLEDILVDWGREDCEIFIVLAKNSKHRPPELNLVHVRVHYILPKEAQDLIKAGTHFSAVVVSRSPLEEELLEILPVCYRYGHSVLNIGRFYELVCRKVPLFKIGDGWIVHTSFRQPPPISSL